MQRHTHEQEHPVHIFQWHRPSSRHSNFNRPSTSVFIFSDESPRGWPVAIRYTTWSARPALRLVKSLAIILSYLVAVGLAIGLGNIDLSVLNGTMAVNYGNVTVYYCIIVSLPLADKGAHVCLYANDSRSTSFGLWTYGSEARHFKM